MTIKTPIGMTVKYFIGQQLTLYCVLVAVGFTKNMTYEGEKVHFYITCLFLSLSHFLLNVLMPFCQTVMSCYFSI